MKKGIGQFCSPIFLLLIGCPLTFSQDYCAEAQFKIPLGKQEKTNTVERAVDGDTLLLSNGERIRLIGVDTPETVHPNKPVEHFGKEAKAFAQREIEGREARLEFDWQKNDKYGRTLAYVYRKEDNFFLNAEIIKQGYGHAYTRFPFKYLEEFRRYEREARENGRGLWQ